MYKSALRIRVSTVQNCSGIRKYTSHVYYTSKYTSHVYYVHFGHFYATFLKSIAVLYNLMTLKGQVHEGAAFDFRQNGRS